MDFSSSQREPPCHGTKVKANECVSPSCGGVLVPLCVCVPVVRFSSLVIQGAADRSSLKKPGHRVEALL